MRRNLFLGILAGLAACTTVSTTEFCYDQNLVQYVTAPAIDVRAEDADDTVELKLGAVAAEGAQVRTVPANSARDPNANGGS